MAIHVLGVTKVALHRRFIQAILVYDCGYEPRIVTEILGKLRRWKSFHVFQTELDVLGERSHIYSLGRSASESEKSQIGTLIQLRQETLQPNVLGPAGEGFIRSCLIETGEFEDVTRRQDLGRLTDDDGKNRIDLYATNKRTGTRYAISVKNQAEWLYSGNRGIRDAHTKAKAHGRVPWLVAPFFSDPAKARCANNPEGPIRFTEIGAQVMPSRIAGRDARVLLEELAPLIGPQPIVLFGTRFKADQVSTRLIRDLSAYTMDELQGLK
jgi:hypothetical protein